jgi:hypothetical protein
MKMNSAKELQEFINSIRAKAFEDVASLIKSDAVTKGDYNLLMIDANDLIELINSIDSAKLKKQKEEETELDNLV